MRIKNLIKPIAAFSILLAVAGTNTLFADAPKAVADMNKKELKIHKRNISNYMFDTQAVKDRKSGLTWFTGPTVNEELTPSIQQYFRVGYTDTALYQIQLIVTYNKYDIGVYDKDTMDFKQFALWGKPVPAAPQRGIPDNNAATLITTVRFSKADLVANKDKGFHLKGISEHETIDFPVRPDQVTAILNTMNKHEAKLAKKK